LFAIFALIRYYNDMDVLWFSSASATPISAKNSGQSASAAAVFLSALPRKLEDFCRQIEISG
jgi:hypothetical protein